ncbi:hypothetical protein DL765_009245 [Monosporascus sp. GIB2]|nr:hypothetical protein DL765_009245 [Monosporascus sp. GIB2]
MWDQYNIGFGNNRVEPPASLPASLTISIPISARDGVPVEDSVSFPAKVPVKVKVETPPNLPAGGYPQREREVSGASILRGLASACLAVALLDPAQLNGLPPLLLALPRNISRRRAEETRRAANDKERPEFGDTGATRGVTPREILQQAATNSGGLVPTEILEMVLENVGQVEAENLELNDGLRALESQQEENPRRAESIGQGIEDTLERLAELERQERGAWPGFPCKMLERDSRAAPRDKGKAPVCSTCKVKAAESRHSTTAGFGSAAEAEARKNGSPRLRGKISPARNRGADQLEDDLDAAGPRNESATGVWRGSESSDEKQSPRQKRRRLSDADAEEADSESSYRGRAATRTEESRKKRRQEQKESGHKPTRRSPRIARQRGAQSAHSGAKSS